MCPTKPSCANAKNGRPASGKPLFPPLPCRHISAARRSIPPRCCSPNGWSAGWWKSVASPSPSSPRCGSRNRRKRCRRPDSRRTAFVSTTSKRVHWSMSSIVAAPSISRWSPVPSLSRIISTPSRIPPNASSPRASSMPPPSSPPAVRMPYPCPPAPMETSPGSTVSWRAISRTNGSSTSPWIPMPQA